MLSGDPLCNMVWRFNGDGTDETGRNNGTISGAVFQGGKIGRSLYTDGVDDYCEAANVGIPNTGPHSFGGWVKAAVAPAGTSIMGTTSAWQSDSFAGACFLHSASTLYYQFYGAAAENNGRITNAWGDFPTTWQHIVGTWDGTTGTNGMTLYLNGAKVGNGTSLVTDITPSNSRKFRVAKIAGSNEYGVNGNYDEIFIFRRVLNLAEVKQIYEGFL